MTSRIKTIDYVKAVCIIMVIIMHCELYGFIDKVALMPFYVDLAVPCFFMITGYTLTLRMKRRISKAQLNKKCSIKILGRGGYSLFRDLKPILIPYTFAFLIIIFAKFFDGTKYDLAEFLILYITGSAGTGGYFVIVYIQILIIFPFIYLLISRFCEKGLFISILVNILFEITIQIFIKNGFELLNIYKLICIRYLSTIALGIYCVDNKEKMTKQVLISMFLIGFLYILCYAYLNINWIGVTYWPHSSFYTSFYICPIILLIIKKDKKLLKESSAGKILSIIGKNSYSIFCVQMAFFTNKYSWHIGDLSMFTMMFLAVSVCLIVGLIYGKLCNKILKMF